MIVSILVFIIIFSVIVISHEFGHFMVARRNGIRVNEFEVGMGPVLWQKKRGDTMFSIRLLPIGGACVFDGMNGLEQEKGDFDEHAFQNAPVIARIATSFAGPMANFIVGFVFALILVTFSGTDLPVIQQIMPDSAAEEAGLQAGDIITKIDGENIHIYREISIISALNYGEPLTITYSHDGTIAETTITPRYDEETDRYYIGLQGAGEWHKCNALEVFKYGFYEAEYWVKVTFKSLGTIFNGHFSKDSLNGPVGVVKIVDDTYDQAKPYGLPTVVLSFLNLATLLSINLGIMNLLPLPALDGGRLIFLFIEAVRGKPVSPEKEGMVHLIGILCLFALMIFVMFNDISKFFR